MTDMEIFPLGSWDKLNYSLETVPYPLREARGGGGLLIACNPVVVVVVDILLVQ